MITTNKIPIGQVESEVSQTITNGVINKAPSEDAVFDALALKLNLSDAPYDISAYRKTGVATIERWYNNSINATALTTFAAGKDIIRYFPIILSKACTLDRIAVEITGAGTAGSVVRLGIYDNSNMSPNNLILDAGTILGDSATAQTISINETLQAGLYFLTINHNSVANITFRAVPLAATPNLYGSPSALGATIGGYPSIASAYSTFADPASYAGNVTNAVPISIFFRLSA
jgi:hypothetical protein